MTVRTRFAIGALVSFGLVFVLAGCGPREGPDRLFFEPPPGMTDTPESDVGLRISPGGDAVRERVLNFLATEVVLYDSDDGAALDTEVTTSRVDGPAPFGDAAAVRVAPKNEPETGQWYELRLAELPDDAAWGDDDNYELVDGGTPATVFRYDSYPRLHSIAVMDEAEGAELRVRFSEALRPSDEGNWKEAVELAFSGSCSFEEPDDALTDQIRYDCSSLDVESRFEVTIPAGALRSDDGTVIAETTLEFTPGDHPEGGGEYELVVPIQR